MYTKQITYTDYNGVERTEDFYFNLNRSELVELNLSAEGGLDAAINRIIQTKNGKDIIDVIKRVILKSYGEKSLDGKYLHKSEEISQNFFNTEAYDVLFMELVTDDKKAAEFMERIIPKKLRESMEQTSENTVMELV